MQTYALVTVFNLSILDGNADVCFGNKPSSISLPQGGGQEGALPLPNLLRRMSMCRFPHAPTDAERYEQGDEEEYSWIKP